MEFKEFPKMGRFSRDFVITEKIDGTNASINLINVDADEDKTNIVATTGGFNLRIGSRNRWINPSDDNMGFAKWVIKNLEDIVTLGEGHHFGEWWGNGIQRNYGLSNGDKRFSLFNVIRWNIEKRPTCVGIVPILNTGNFDTININVENTLNNLKINGSAAVLGFMKPEGIVIWHAAANIGFKKTLEKDEIPKSLQKLL